MNQEELKQSIKTLQTELDKLDKLDSENDAMRERLRHLIDEIEQQLAHPENEDQKDSLIEKLQHSIEQFEVEHPRITGIMNRIMMTLSDMGI